MAMNKARMLSSDSLKSLTYKDSVFGILLDNPFVSVAILDRHLNFVQVNRLYATLADRQSDELCHKNFFDVFPALSALKPVFKNVIETKIPYRETHDSFVYPNHPERGVFYWDWECVPVCSENGVAEYLVVIGRNETEHVRLERENSLYMDKSLDIQLVLDFNGTVLRVNPAFERVLGYSCESIMGKQLHHLIHPEDRDKQKESEEIVRNGEHIQNKVTRLLSCDGRVIWLSWTVLPVKEQGVIFITGRDITDIKIMENSFQILFDSSPMCIAIATLKDGRYVAVNKTWQRTIGYTSKEAIGKTPVELNMIACEATKRIGEEIKKHGKTIQADNSTIRTRNGELRNIVVSTNFIDFNGEPCLLVAGVDLTEKRAMELEIERLERMNLIGQMAGGIGHEIRNPMTTVRGFLQMMMQKEKFQDEMGSLDLMISELDRANSIITEFLSLANRNIEATQPQKLNDVVEKLLPLIEAHAFQENKDIALELADVPECLMKENEIRQLILNLVRNALDASQEGQAVLIKTYADENSSVLVVKDQGCGIPTEIRKKLGTPFVTTKEKGTGLGLAICYSIVNSHNGKLEIDTASTGTTVKAFFPKI